MRSKWMSTLMSLMLWMAAPAAASTSVNADGIDPAAVAAATEAAAYFESAIGARRDCFGNAAVGFEDLSNRRGEYRPGQGMVVVDTGRSPATVRETVLHELGHHLTLECRAYADADLSERFFAAQGLPVDRGWFDYSAGWDGTPAEHFAEALVAVISGHHPSSIVVTSQARRVVAAWLKAAPLPSVDPVDPPVPVPPASPTASPSPEAVPARRPAAPRTPPPARSVAPAPPSVLVAHPERVRILFPGAENPPRGVLRGASWVLLID